MPAKARRTVAARRSKPQPKAKVKARPAARRGKAGGSASSSAARVAWNLGDLYAGHDDPRLPADEQGALADAKAFAADYRGRINVPGGPTPEVMAEALQRYEAILDKAYRPGSFAGLLHAADTLRHEHGALVAHTQEAGTAIQTTLMFFELEWIALSDADAAAAIASPRCQRWRHYLASIRRYKPHTLTEPEEIILAEKVNTGAAAFARLFDEQTSATRFPVKLAGKVQQLTQSAALALLYSPDRKARIAAHAGFTEGLRKAEPVAGYILNTLVQDHAVNNRLRHYAGPADSRHLANEIEPASVDALMTACERHGRIVGDYYRLKGRLLGLKQLFDYDRYAPVALRGMKLPTCDWATCCRQVHSAYERFSPRLGQIVREFMDKNWIDAAPRPGKRGGAFCSSTVPALHPYILMNYTDRLRDVMTLAHELGHGVHMYLSNPQGILQCSTPLTLAETASVFGEMLTFEQLLAEQRDPKVRLSLLCGKLEDSFATVFRQVVLTRFEQKVHAARAQGEVSAEQFGAMWLEANEPMFDGAVKLTPEYRHWWSYIGHFYHSPFYCYAYAFGELLVLALWAQYKREGAAFVPKYLDLLSAGGSDTPARLVARLGLDINDPGFWSAGLTILGEMVGQARELAKAL